MPQAVRDIEANLTKIGFSIRDVKYLLSTELSAAFTRGEQQPDPFVARAPQTSGEDRWVSLAVASPDELAARRATPT